MIRKLTRLIVMMITFQILIGCIPQNDAGQKTLAESTDKIQALTNTIQTLEKEKSKQKEEFESQIEKLNSEMSALTEINRLPR